MVQMKKKEELKFTGIINGLQYVMTIGTALKQQLFVDN